jgi:alcohol dehydrogenase class IV
VIDTAKAIASITGARVAAIPTTLSGAEWANRTGVTDESESRKRGFSDPKTVPRVVVLDPEATVFTPEKLWLSTGIRALDHAVEGFLYGGDHPVTDVTGLEGARRLMEYLPLSKREPEDLDVRLELQLAAWLSYFGPANTPMGLSGALGGEPPARVSSLVRELGLPDRLREVGVPEEDLEDIAGEYGDRAGEALAILTAAY